MKLIDYLNALPIDKRSEFANQCGTSFDYLRQVAYGNRQCRESLAINIERESERAVTCEELRNDVDWAFIRATGHSTPRDGQRRTSERRIADRRDDDDHNHA